MPIHLRRTLAAVLAITTLTLPLMPQAVAAVSPAPPDLVAQAGLLATNHFRASMGLPPMTIAAALAAAARSHSEYMARNHFTGHYEQPGDPTSTGNSPADRTAYYGYPDFAGEVVDYAMGPAGNSVQRWVDTLYHRVAFIDPSIAEAGLGSGQDTAVSGGYSVTTEDFGKKNWDAVWSKAVVYPRDGQTGVAASWDAMESPNPLRLFPEALDSSGDPLGPTGTVITASFFDGYVKSATVTTASLTAKDGSTPAFWTLTPVTDDHLRETVSLIPKAPLQPATQYRVHVAGSYTKGFSGTTVPYDLTWAFTTAKAGQIDDTKLKWSGGAWTLTVTGTQLSSASRLLVGGVPVQFNVQGDGSLKARLDPTWSLSEEAHVEAEWPDGSTAQWDRYWIASDKDLIKPVAGQPYTLGKTALRTVSASGQTWLEAGMILPGDQAQDLGGLHVLKVGTHLLEWADDSRAVYADGTRNLMPFGPARAGGVSYLPVAWWSDLLASWGIKVTPPGGSPAAPPASQSPVLTDITGYWAEAQIRRLVTAGVVSGMGDGTFRPNAQLTRAAFVKMLVAAQKLNLSAGTASGFTDTGAHWAETQGYLSAAVQAKLLVPGEYPGDRFEPDRPITREEIAVLVVRALGMDARARAQSLSLANGQATIAGKAFSDAGTWQRPGYVSIAVQEGIVTGYAEDGGTFTYRPLNQATRAEAVVMVVRMLDHK